MNIIDISLSLDNNTVAYPGNIPLSITTHHAMPKYATQLSSITFGSHTGTHIDFPAHGIQGALSSDQIPLSVFFGVCRVFDFSKSGESAVTKEMLETKKIQKNERVLLKTKNSLRGFKEFYEDYIYLDGDAADYLAELGVLLVGIDSLSIKQRGSNDHRPHTALLAKNIPIVEGLNLEMVKEGGYELVCLPLKFIGIEGSPARAILVEK